MGRLSSLLIGTITGASAAYFLTTKKGKELTNKDKTQEVVDFSQDAIQTIKDKIQQKTGSQVAPLLSKSELESEEIVLDLEDKPVASEAVKTTVEDDVEAE